MKTVIITLLFIIATIDTFADIKWIPIEPIKPEQAVKRDNNLSQLQPMNKMLDNLKIIQHLLDKESDAEDLDEDGNKNWYNLQDIKKASTISNF